MSFLSIKTAYEHAKSQKEKKVLEQTIASTNMDELASKLAGLQATNSKTDLANNKEFQKLAAMQTAYDTQKDKLDSEIALLDENIKSYKEAMKDGIKETFSLWCFG